MAKEAKAPKTKEVKEKQAFSINSISKKKNAALPSKQTINFVIEKRRISPMKLVIVILLVLLVLAVAGKYGFLDQMAKVDDAEANLASKQAELAAVNAKIASYGDLADSYERYSYYWMTESELALVDRLDVLHLLEDEVMGVATVENFALDDNILTMNIHGVTLDRASRIVNELESSPLVESAAVYSASAEDAMEASIFMSVTLTKEATEE